MLRIQTYTHTVARAIIIGDIHGCFPQLQHLLKLVNFSNYITREHPQLLTAASLLASEGHVTSPPPPPPSSSSSFSSSSPLLSTDDLCVFVGDLVNKGPDSFSTVRLLRAIGAVGVLGNHDIKLVRLAEKLRAGTPLSEKEEASSLLPLARACPDDVLEYLQDLPHALQLPQFRILVVHAGVDPTLPLDKQDVEAVTRMRVLAKHADYDEGKKKHDAKGKDPLVVLETSAKYVALEKGPKIGHRWADVWCKEVEKLKEKEQAPGKKPPSCMPEFADVTVVFGHDAKSRLQDCKYAVGLDTGCVYGGTLTALVEPGRSLVSVPGYQQEGAPVSKV